MSNKTEILKNHNSILKEVNDNISKSIECNDINKIQEYRNNAINLLSTFVDCLEITDYLLIDSKPKISEQIFFDSYFTLGTLYKSFVETEIQNEINSKTKAIIPVHLYGQMCAMDKIINLAKKNKIIVISTIDNLIKGGAGQAVQNLNMKFNFPIKTALS